MHTLCRAFDTYLRRAVSSWILSMNWRMPVATSVHRRPFFVRSTMRESRHRRGSGNARRPLRALVRLVVTVTSLVSMKVVNSSFLVPCAFSGLVRDHGPASKLCWIDALPSLLNSLLLISLKVFMNQEHLKSLRLCPANRLLCYVYNFASINNPGCFFTSTC